jgi:hypothetical protein
MGSMKPFLLASTLLVSACAGQTQVIFLDDLPSGGNAYNNGRDAILMVRGKRDIGAIYAQELQEVEARKFMDPVDRVFFNADDSRRAEAQIFSHAVEVAAAEALYGRDAANYRHREAKGMQGWYSYFDDYSVEQVEAAMLQRQPAARDWVEAHLSELQRFMRHAAADAAGHQRITPATSTQEGKT